MGSENLVNDCEFLRNKSGLATRNYNALAEWALRCRFADDGIALDQASAGSFDVFDSRLEHSTQTDFQLRNSAGDCTYVYNTETTTLGNIFNSGHTGAVINALFDGCRYLGKHEGPVTNYASGGSLIFLNSELGGGVIGGGGSIACSTALLIGCTCTQAKPAAIGGRARNYCFPFPVKKEGGDRK